MQKIIDGKAIPLTPAEITAKQAEIAAYDGRIKKRKRAEMEREAFALAAAQAGFVTFQEATDWSNGNAMPAAIQTMYNGLDASEQGQAYFDIMARRMIRRNSRWMPGAAQAFGTDDAGIDALFGIT